MWFVYLDLDLWKNTILQKQTRAKVGRHYKLLHREKGAVELKIKYKKKKSELKTVL